MRYVFCLICFAMFPHSTAAQTNENSVDCASACVIPAQAPPECECRVIGVNARSDISNPDPQAKAIIDGVRDAYAEAVADVQNYTTVQTTSAGGPPVVMYYEKFIIDDYPVFRLVSPAEIASREAEAMGAPPTQDMIGGLASILEGVANGETPGQEADPSGDTRERSGGILGGIVGRLAGRAARELREVESQGAGVIENRADLEANLFKTRAAWKHMDFYGDIEVVINGELTTCKELYAKGHEINEADANLILG